MEGITREVVQSSSGDPQKCKEAGGVLLGSFGRDEITINDFEPIPCEHAVDQGYHLSVSDREALVETLQWVKGGSLQGLSLVGFYRSHGRYEMSFGEEDHKLLARYFPSAENVFLLINPGTEELICNIYFWNDGQLLTVQDSERLSSEAVAADAVPLPDTHDLVPTIPQSTAPVLQSFDRRRARASWIIPAMIAASLILAAAFGYSSLKSRYAHTSTVQRGSVGLQRIHPSATRPTAGPTRPLPATPKPSPFPDKQAESEEPVPDQYMRVKVHSDRQPVPVEDREDSLPEDPATTAQVTALLLSWTDALKAGNENAYITFYAPQLTSYFTRREVDRDEVRKSVEDSFTKYGRFVVCDLSNIKVTPLGPDRAAAVFRKSWAASGGKKFAGDELERCLLTRDGGGWKITSEQEVKLYWVRKEH